MKILQSILKHIEFAAYLLAIWSFLVLFFEPVIGYYMNFVQVENITALANLVLLMLTILNRLIFAKTPGFQKLVVFDILMLVLGAMLFFYQAKFAVFFLLIRQTYFILQFFLVKFSDGKFSRWLSTNPPVVLMLSFATAIFIGSVLLMLPMSSNNNQVTPFVDALFTSTSATCVTGLTVVETGEHFSLIGQIIILILIQIGGLGIMTISTFFALILGQNINLKLRNVVTQAVGGTNTVNVFLLLKIIVWVTFSIEAVGALVLFLKFSTEYPLSQAVYQSIFHSISAFCNAGFSPIKGNLVGYLDSPIVSLTIPMLIILGGIGFSVIIDVSRHISYKDKARRLSLHSKIVLLTTISLIVLGFFAYFFFEYDKSMQGYSILRRLMASFFHSVSARTAGFNTLNMEQLYSPTVLFTIALMFIGASPGSTGGGIKTTTFALLVLSILSMLKGKRDMSLFKRRIHLENYHEAIVLTMLSVILVFGVVIVLMLTESQAFERIIFEAVSAFGTVGLSMGVTTQLTVAGKLLITMLMFIGRIGPLTMIYAFAIRKKHTSIKYAEETISIG